MFVTNSSENNVLKQVCIKNKNFNKNNYKKQPLRKDCKNCGSKKIKSFIKNFDIS